MFIQNLQAAETSAKLTVNTGAWHAISTASPVVQFTLLTLVFLSIASWAIFFKKRAELKKTTEANSEFSKFFWGSKSLDNVFSEISAYENSSIAKVFKKAYEELQYLAEESKGDSPNNLRGIENIERIIRTSSDEEIAKLEKGLTLLATTGSTGPFIGLFGTVWGIMGAFQKIGIMGSASLAVVAPGIAEALIATGVGLAAAIPAVIAYNHFISQIHKQEIVLQSFSTDLLNVMKRNWFNS
ncbi:MAG: protein TolQ [Bdellovibrionales bacterium]